MASFETFFYPSAAKGQQVYALVCKPEGAPRAVVQIAHGVAEHIGRYRDFMAFLADHGFLAAGNDHLGHGKTAANDQDLAAFSPEDGWNCVVRDMVQLHDRMAAQYPGPPYVMFGHSMGSFLTRTYLLDYPQKYDMAIISGTGHHRRPVSLVGLAVSNWIVKRKGYYSDGTRLNSMTMGCYQKRIAHPRTSCDWLSRDPEVVDRYLADPRCNFTAKAGLLRDLVKGVRYVTKPSNLSRLSPSKPVFFLSGTEDPVGEWGKAVPRAYAAFRKAGVQDVTMKLYAGGRHEMLNELNREEVYQDILCWLEQRIKEQAHG